MSTPGGEFTPHAISRRSWLVLALILLVGVAVYAWVVITYNNGNRRPTRVGASKL